MAVNIGPKIGIDGEAEYRKALQNIIQEQKTLKSEMEKTAASFDKSASSQEKSAKQVEILNRQIENQQDRVAKLSDMVEKSSQKTGENSTETLKWKQALNEAETELSRLQSELSNQTGLTSFANNLKESGEKLQKIGGGIKSAGDALTKTFTAPIVAAGTVVTGFAITFEDAMAKVSTIADTTEVPIDTLKQQIIDLSNETGIGADQIADAVYNAISAGQSTADAVNFVANATALARAGFTDTAAATDILTTALNAYGMEAEEVTRVSDVLITTQNLGKTTVNELASYMGKVIPTAKAQGVSIENLASMYAVMTANGINTANTTTYLSSMLNELGKTGSKAFVAFAEGTSDIEEGGISMAEAMERGWSLTDVLGVLETQAEKSGTSVSNLFGSAEAGKAATVLIDNAQQLNTVFGEMTESAGATDEAYGKLETTSFEAQKALNELKNTGMEFGNTILEFLSPAIKNIGEAVHDFSTWVKGLDDDQKKAILTAAGAIAVVGPIVSTIGSIIIGIGQLSAGIGALIPLFTAGGAAAGGTAAVLAGPVVLAVGAVVAAGVMLITHWEEVKEMCGALADLAKAKWNELKSNTKLAFENVKKSVGDNISSAKDTVVSKAGELKTNAETTWNNLKSATSTTWENIRTDISNKISDAQTSANTTIETLRSGAETAWSTLQSATSTAWDAIKEKIVGNSKDADTDGSSAFEHLQESIGTSFEAISKAVEDKIGAARKFFEDGIKAMKDALNFEWHLPHLDLPHISVSGGEPPYGIGGKGSLPHFSIEWYKKAYQDAVMFMSPTVLATGSGMKGFGDGGGSEIVIGTNRLLTLMREAVGTSNQNSVVINVYGAPGQDIEELADIIEDHINANIRRQEAVYG